MSKHRAAEHKPGVEPEPDPAAEADAATEAERAAEPERPALRIVRGDPTVEELAAITALVSAASQGGAAPAPRHQHGGWNDPARQHRPPLVPGPNGWRAAL